MKIFFLKKVIIAILSIFVLSCAPMQTGSPLDFKKIPWGKYEISNYKIISKKNNKEQGKCSITIKKENNVCKFILVIDNNIKVNKECNMDCKTFVPISTHKKIKNKSEYEIISFYKDSFANITILGKGIKKKLQLETPQYFYENDIIIFLLRAVPFSIWKNKKDLKFNIISSQIGQHFIADAKLVKTHDIIEIQNKKIPSYKIMITSPGIDKHYVYYEKNNARRLLKYENKENVYILE